MNKTLPFLVANVIEILDVDPEDLGGGEVDGANVDLDSQRKGQCAVIKTSTRQTYFLPGTTLYAYKLRLTPIYPCLDAVPTGADISLMTKLEAKVLIQQRS